MTTYTALTTTSGEAAATALGDSVEALEPTGVGVFEIEDGSGRWEVGAYFTDRPDEIGLALLAAAHGAEPFVVSAVPERDWAAHVRRQLTPVEAGRFVVHGAHDRERVTDNKLGLEIEAAMAFGTGHHGTTRGCLLALDWLAKRGLRAERIADVGCGTGVLAMAAAKLWPARIWAGDLDRLAVDATRANIRANGVSPRISVVQAPGMRDQRLRELAPVDLVLANILARPLKRLAPQFARAAAPGAVVVLSGLLTRQRNDVSGVYRAWGFHPLKRFELDGWATLVLRRG